MLLSAAAAIAYLDRVVISNVVKELQSEIGISDREAGWVLASFVLGYSMMQIPMGRLGAVSYTHLTLPTNREV